MKRAGFMMTGVGILLLFQIAQADWTTARRLTWTAGASYSPKIALDSSGRLHLVWYDDTPGHNEIYYKKSTDSGDTWATAKRITWSSGDSQYPALAIDPSDRLHVVWVEDTSGGSEIYYKRSSDGGGTWTAKQRLTWAGITSSRPDIAVDSLGVIHLVWQDSTGEIHYSKSPDGTNWMLEKRLTWNSGNSQYPDIAIDSSGRLHVVWQDNTPGEFNYEIYYKKSTDAGLAWTTAKRLTWMENGSYRPDLAVDPSENLHLVWYDENPSLYKIYYKKSTDSGGAWTTAKRLTYDDGWTAYPCLAVDASGTLHLVWENMDGDLSYRKSANSGSTWTAIQRLTWTVGSSWDPIMVADPSGNLYLVWSDNTPGNREIYFKKGN
jgi:BNR repeat-containing family member